MPEIFHPEPHPDAHLEVETNYFNFLERHTGGDIKPVLVSADETRHAFAEYLSYLRTFTSSRYILLDVKYNSTHHLDFPWRQMTEEPGLFTLLREQGMWVLNVTRRNYLRYYLSWLKGETTKRYTVDEAGADAKDYDDPKVTIVPAKLMWALELCRLEDEMVARNLAGWKKYFTVDYAQLFVRPGHPPAAAQLSRISDWLEIDEFDPQPPQYRKQGTKSLRGTVENYEDVAAALRGTQYETFLGDEPISREADDL